jgi:putative ABC transport system ATP-binding protein
MSMLELKEVTKIYGADENVVTALDTFSLKVSKGELVAVVGPSGSGKTTLLAITGALLHPTTGRVSLNGTDVTSLPAKELAKFRLEKIGFVLQSANLVPFLTARDQLLLVAKLAKKLDKSAYARADQLLMDLGLTKRANHYPEGLSGGERQRVAIGRALMNDPELILADEPTANLDSNRGREVVEMLAREVKTRQKIGIMVTHDERMLDMCDRVVYIADGRLSVLRAAA